MATVKTKVLKVTMAKVDIERIGRAMRRWRWGAAKGALPRVFAIDPGSGGSRPTGWCLILEDGTILSGEGDPDVVVAEAGAALDIAGGVDLFAREGPYTLSREQMSDDDSITPQTLYRMGFAAGYVTGAIDFGAGLGKPRRLASAALWEPMPTQWRAVLGLNRKSDGVVEAREATADAVWLWARAQTGLPLLTPQGRRRVDQAMAVGIASAAVDIAGECERLAA